MPTPSLLFRVLLLAIALFSSAAVDGAETNDANLVVSPFLKDSQEANHVGKLSVEDNCYADPNFLDVPGEIFFVCPDFCGEGNDWSVFISNNVAPPFTIFTCISKCLPPDEDVFDCTFTDYSLGEPSEVCPIVCPGSSVGGCGLFGLGKPHG